jgi:hypothetical protein
MMEIGSRMAIHGKLESLMENFIDFVEANTKKWGPSHNFTGEPEKLVDFEVKRIQSPFKNTFSSINTRKRKMVRSYQNSPNGKQMSLKVVMNHLCQPCYSTPKVDTYGIIRQNY